MIRSMSFHVGICIGVQKTKKNLHEGHQFTCSFCLGLLVMLQGYLMVIGSQVPCCQCDYSPKEKVKIHLHMIYCHEYKDMNVTNVNI